MSGERFVPTDGWLEQANCMTQMANTSGQMLSSTNCIGTHMPDYTFSYPYWNVPISRPIKLTLSEIERLRKAAKADDKLKAILAKFTGQIEITVDFE